MEFIKNHWKKIIVILIFPFILDWILRFIWWIDIPIKESAAIGEWLGFLGAYFGIIAAICGIWWQLNEEKRKQQLGSLKILKYSLELILSKLDSKINERITQYIFLNSNIITDIDNLLLKQKNIEELKEYFKNISSLPFGIDIYMILSSIEHIENIFHKSVERHLNLKNDFIFYIKDNPDFFKKIDTIFKEDLNAEKVNELLEVINSFRKSIIVNCTLNDETQKKIVENFTKVYFYIKDIRNIVWGGSNFSQIYTFEILEKEIKKNIIKIEEEIKKLS